MRTNLPNRILRRLCLAHTLLHSIPPLDRPSRQAPPKMPGVPAAGAVAAARHSPTTLQTAPAHATKPEAFKAPVIDGRGFLARNRNEELPPLEVAEAIAEAGKAYGSFQLINHGVEQKLIERMQVRPGWRQQAGGRRACGSAR